MTGESNNQALIEFAKAYLGASEFAIDDLKTGEIGRYAVVPAGQQLMSVKKYVDEWRARPERREGTATLTTLASFSAHVNRFKDDNSIVFADVTNSKDAKLITVFDYNEKSAAGAPRFGKHKAIYPFPLSDEWIFWTAVNGKSMTQVEFAQLLEDRILDVLAPSETGQGLVQDFAQSLGEAGLATSQRLQELANGLSIRADVAVTNASNLSSGESRINFQEAHVNGETGGPISVPKGFAIGIPVFRGGAPYAMPVRLRYRLDKEKGKVLWTVLLWRADRIWDDAVKIVCDTAHADTGLDLLYGTPEKV